MFLTTLTELQPGDLFLADSYDLYGGILINYRIYDMVDRKYFDYYDYSLKFVGISYLFDFDLNIEHEVSSSDPINFYKFESFQELFELPRKFILKPPVFNDFINHFTQPRKFLTSSIPLVREWAKKQL